MNNALRDNRSVEEMMIDAGVKWKQSKTRSDMNEPKNLKQPIPVTDSMIAQRLREVIYSRIGADTDDGLLIRNLMHAYVQHCERQEVFRG